jgi:hypothetical protein
MARGTVVALAKRLLRVIILHRGGWFAVLRGPAELLVQFTDELC